jgi:hypothetical protein
VPWSSSSAAVGCNGTALSLGDRFETGYDNPWVAVVAVKKCPRAQPRTAQKLSDLNENHGLLRDLHISDSPLWV